MTNPGNLTDEQMQVLAQRIAAMADTSTDAPAKGVRQYVGARYVPLFATPIDWSDTREYEPLTIVLYQGNSYTSRQYVPTGIDVTNNEYWALTGNFNAQVEAYRQEVEQYRKDIEGIAKNASFVSLGEIGGVSNNPDFDNAEIINNYFTSEKENSQILYVPKGLWYIAKTVNLSYCDVVCEGTLVCSDTFQAVGYVTTDGETVLPAVMLGFGTEGTYSFDSTADRDTFIVGRNWNLKIDCSLVTGVSGVVMHRTWKCNLHVFIENAIKYGVFTGKYITESRIDGLIGVYNQHGTEIVGDTGIVVRAPDAILGDIITMHYLCGIDFKAPNTVLNFWHGYGYYDAAREGVGIRFSTEGNIVLGTIFNDGCKYCFDFKSGVRTAVALTNYFETGRTSENQLFLIKNFDASWNHFIINNLLIPFIAEDAVIKEFICSYLCQTIKTHHAGPMLNHLRINNFNQKRKIFFNSANDPYWNDFDAWKLPVTDTPLVGIEGTNVSFTKDVLNAKHIYGITDTPIYKNTIGNFDITVMENYTSNTTSDVGTRLQIRGTNQLLYNNVMSQGGEGSTNVNVVVENVSCTYATVNI